MLHHLTGMFQKKRWCCNIKNQSEIQQQAISFCVFLVAVSFGYHFLARERDYFFSGFFSAIFELEQFIESPQGPFATYTLYCYHSHTPDHSHRISLSCQKQDITLCLRMLQVRIPKKRSPSLAHVTVDLIHLLLRYFFVLGSAAAIGHTLENSIPLSIFPVAPDKFVICFCGLPGRGKTHISRRLGRYLEFFHAIPIQMFHAADYRRRLCGALKDSDWFDPENEEAKRYRLEAAKEAIKDMTLFMSQNSNGVAIIDGINETHAKRQALVDAVRNCKYPRTLVSKFDLVCFRFIRFELLVLKSCGLK
jgi:hypothetical protein